MTMPFLGAPFLASFRTQFGPPGLLGRFFLNAERRMAEGGVRLEFISMDELVRVYERNKQTWGALIPTFDPRISDMDAGSVICLAARDRNGEVICCTGGRRYDLAEGETLRTIVEDGRFFGLRPQSGARCEITAPVASELTGRLVYCGGLWVHPEWRGFRLASHFPRLIHAVAHTLWDADHLLGLVKADVVGSGLHQRYGYSSCEASFRYIVDGEVAYDGLLVWMSADELINDLARSLDLLWPKIDPRSVAGDAQNTA